jgi:hypothetical protein
VPGYSFFFFLRLRRERGSGVVLHRSDEERGGSSASSLTGDGSFGVGGDGDLQMSVSGAAIYDDDGTVPRKRASAGKHIGAAGGRLAELRAFLKAFEARRRRETWAALWQRRDDEDNLARRKFNSEEA